MNTWGWLHSKVCWKRAHISTHGSTTDIMIWTHLLVQLPQHRQHSPPCGPLFHGRLCCLHTPEWPHLLSKEDSSASVYVCGLMSSEMLLYPAVLCMGSNLMVLRDQCQIFSCCSDPGTLRKCPGEHMEWFLILQALLNLYGSPLPW